MHETRPDARVSLRWVVSANNAQARSLFEREGYRSIRQFWRVALELVDSNGDELLARLSSKGAFSSRVRAETADGHWIFERTGLRQAITIQAIDAHTELASVKRGMNGQATLLFPDGREYRWQCSSFWHFDCPDHRIARAQGNIEIHLSKCW
jgi:hypothetical protein